MNEVTRVKGVETRNGHQFSIVVTDISKRNEVSFDIYVEGDDSDHPFRSATSPSYLNKQEAWAAIMNVGVAFNETGILPNLMKAAKLSPRPSLSYAATKARAK